MNHHFSIKSFFVTVFLFGTFNHLEAQGTRAVGVVKGIVTSGFEKTPLQGAIVRIAADSISTTTESDGSFEFQSIPVGYNAVSVTAEGYSDYISESFEVSAFYPTKLNIPMDKYTLSEVIVTASSPLRSSVESPLSLRKIGREEIDLTPGANRDISKVVQAAPGVVTVSQNNRNDILVRGGGANENKYFIDDIEIPVLNHFSVQGGSGGYASLVNTDLLNGVNFYTGAFPTSLANGLSSVLDMKMKNGNTERIHAKGIVGASDVGVTLDTPLSKSKNTTFIGSFRRSYLQLLFGVLKLPFLPTYNDFQFKVTSKIGKNDELYALGLGAFDKNRLNRDITDPSESTRYILGYLPNNDQTSYVLGIGYKHSFKKGQLKIIVSRDYLRNNLFKFQNNDPDQPKTMDINSRESNYRVKAMVNLWNVHDFRISAGVGGGYGALHNNSNQQIYTGTQYINHPTTNDLGIFRYDLFGTVSRYFFNNSLSLLFGIRMDGMNYSSKTSNPLRQISPRFSVAYNISPKWSINATVARYYQEPTYTTLGYRSTENPQYDQQNNLTYLNVNQYVAGIRFSPNDLSSLSVEGFFKQYGNLPVSLLDSLPITTGNLTDYIVGNVPARSVGRGKAYGVEFAYRNLNFHNTTLNVSYTLLYSKANKTDENLLPIDNQFWSSSWDVRHIFNVTGIYKFPHNWTFGAKWYFTGGVPYTPYDVELSSKIEIWESYRRPVPNNNHYNFERTGLYHQLDIRLDKVWFFSKWRLGFYVDIQNIYNFKSPGQGLLLPETGTNGQFIKDPNRPGHYLMKSVENNIGGTILPTVGITIEL